MTPMNNSEKQNWIRALGRLRFDITRYDPLCAHKEYDTRHMAEVTLDASSQVRMVITRQIGETIRAQRTSRAGREYTIFSEQNAVTIINYRLRAGDDLAEVLQEMEQEITLK